MTSLSFSREIDDAWATALKDYPELQQVQRSILTGNRFRGGGIECPKNEEGNIVLHFTEGTREQLEELMTHRQRSVELVAEMLRISSEEISPTLLKVFIFLHEAGHAYDYIKNFLEYQIAQDSSTPKTAATAAWRKRFEAEIGSLPVPNLTPDVLKQQIDFGHEIAMEQLNELSDDPAIVHRAKVDPQGLMREQEHAYKSSESEQRADAFAVAVIQRHALIEQLRNP